MHACPQCFLVALRPTVVAAGDCTLPPAVALFLLLRADSTAGKNVTVICSKPQTGYTAGDYTVTVTATAGDPGCDSTQTDTTTVTVTLKPEVNVTGDANQTVSGCTGGATHCTLYQLLVDRLVPKFATTSTVLRTLLHAAAAFTCSSSLFPAAHLTLSSICVRLWENMRAACN